MNVRFTLHCLGTAAVFAATGSICFGAEPGSHSTAPQPVIAVPNAVGSSTEPTSADAPRRDGAKMRQREGAKLTDRRGRFERRGERFVFLSDDNGAHYLVLENLMLERVANVLADSAGGQLSWSIDATATEFRGANYLLLQRAVVKSTHDTDEPRRLGDPLADSQVRPAAKRE
jgi:hypothetical protein